MGDTVVILAQTADTQGGATLSKYQQITQDINSYYGKNAYGRVSFTYTFKDADGSTGKNDWYTVPGTQAGYLDKETDYAIAATKEAFRGADIENNVRIDRVVVVYSGDGQQVDKTRPLATLRSTRQGGFNIDVDSLNGKRTINVDNLIVVSENDPVGTWAHEFGHTLYSKTADFNKIGDRYNYDGKPLRQYGTISYWGLMGSGNWWGSPSGTDPTHMCGFTKEDAGWLRYRDMTMNTGYDQKSLENLNAGDFILRFDDPTSANPHDYMIVEPRDSDTGAYGAPATGVALYYVSYSNNHYVVNFMTTQQGIVYANASTISAGSNATKRTRSYWLPTLYGAASGGPTEYIYPDAHLKVVLVEESFSPYSAKVTLEEFNVTKMKAATASPVTAGEPLTDGNGIVGVNSEEPMPDMDLHAYDDAGNHVGVNYATGMYENNIPGAIASGDLKDAKEWIFVPEDANVRFEVSYAKAAEFAANNPRYASLVEPIDYHMEYVKYDSTGNRYVADGGSGTLGIGATNEVKKPDDQSLSYTNKDIPGFGNNSSGGLCCCLPGLVLAVIGGMVLVRSRMF
jgi:M6 family metalloprotease-like protein